MRSIGTVARLSFGRSVTAGKAGSIYFIQQIIRLRHKDIENARDEYMMSYDWQVEDVILICVYGLNKY